MPRTSLRQVFSFNPSPIATRQFPKWGWSGWVILLLWVASMGAMLYGGLCHGSALTTVGSSLATVCTAAIGLDHCLIKIATVVPLGAAVYVVLFTASESMSTQSVIAMIAAMASALLAAVGVLITTRHQASRPAGN